MGGCIGIHHGWTAACQQHAEQARGRTRAGANRRTATPIGRRTDRGANRGGRAHGGNVISHAGLPVSVHERRFHIRLCAIGERQSDNLQPKPARALDAARLFRFRNAPHHRLIAVRDYDPIHHDRLCEGGAENVARLIAVEPGFKTRNLLTMHIFLNGQTYMRGKAAAL